MAKKKPDPQAEASAALQEVEAWLNDDNTWETDLDGYDHPTVASAVLRKVKEKLRERNLLAQ